MRVSTLIKRGSLVAVMTVMCLCTVFSPAKAARDDDLTVSGPAAGFEELDSVEEPAPTRTELRITLYVKNSPFQEGSGTKENPYIIGDAYGFATFRDDVNSGESFKGQYIKLGKDIDLSSQCGGSKGDWEPIGKFSGSFDGGGHTISGLSIENGGRFSSLIVEVDGDGAIKNLNVKGNISGKYKSAGIVANCWGTLDNCSFSGTVKGVGAKVGGITGECKDITNCRVTGTVSGAKNVGGIVGLLQAGCKAENCSFSGTISVEHGPLGVIIVDRTEDFGGIVGRSCGSVYNCKAEGSVSGYYDVGGIVGTLCSNGKLSGCVFKGPEVSGYQTVGGVVGYICGILVSDSKNYGSVKADSIRAGGITGLASGPVKNCENRGNVAVGGTYAGGIAGDCWRCHGNRGTLEESDNYGNVSGNDIVGGIAGYLTYSLKNCFHYGEIICPGERKGYLYGEAEEDVDITMIGSSFADGNWVMLIILSVTAILAMVVAVLFVRIKKKNE